MGESTKTVRSSYHRAHGKGETTALRIPFGCAVYFIPADCKGFPKGKFEGSGEAGVIAGLPDVICPRDTCGTESTCVGL